VFKAIRIVYRLTAAGEHRPRVERAIEQSRERFCGVSAMLGKTASIEHTLELTEATSTP
jgi:putative redox protein